MVGHDTLNVGIQVRALASQPTKKSKIYAIL